MGKANVGQTWFWPYFSSNNHLGRISDVTTHYPYTPHLTSIPNTPHTPLRNLNIHLHTTIPTNTSLHNSHIFTHLLHTPHTHPHHHLISTHTAPTSHSANTNTRACHQRTSSVIPGTTWADKLIARCMVSEQNVRDGSCCHESVCLRWRLCLSLTESNIIVCVH